MKWLNPVMGLAILSFNLYWVLNIRSNASMWDYEGFSFVYTGNLLLGILFLFYGLYLLFKNDTIEFGEEGLTILSAKDLFVPYSEVHQVVQTKNDSTIQTSKGNFTIQNMFVKNKWAIEKMMFEELNFKKVSKHSMSTYLYLGSILLCCSMMFLYKWEINHFLLLKKIETTQIEGTIIRRADVPLMRNDRGTFPSLSLGGHGVEEFPNIHFRYDGLSPSLKDNVINIQNSDSQKVEEFNARNANYEFNLKYEKFNRFPKGTKVKMKLRTKDYEDLKSFMKTEDYLTNNKENFNLRNMIKIYEFAVNEEIILQKKGLKL